MFRQSLLPHALLAISVGVAVLTPAPPSWSQDSSLDERVDRLERDLNMLQRQVYRGSPPPSEAGTDNGSAVNVEVRMERLEQQMRDLTGRIEEVANQVSRLRQRVGQANSDADMGGGQPAGRPSADTAAPAAGPFAPPPGRPEFAGPPPSALSFPGRPPGGPGDELRPPDFAAAPSDAEPGGGSSSGPTPIFGTLQPPGSDHPHPSASAEPPPAARAGTTGGGLPNGAPAEQFNYAFGLVKKADYSGAETALKEFVERHPNDRMAGSAQFWLGETYYTRGRYAEAASAFAEGYKRYPKSPKAADDLLKLAMSLARSNQKQNACLALAQLDHDFPKGSGAVREHAAAERKRLGC